ncbi:hypothetical protein NC652_024368 [Populus alba x Populus x berolinensis]|nr:hypothetical protein NC652_024368 [Populus alba x Populus x berolinensis]
MNSPSLHLTLEASGSCFKANGGKLNTFNTKQAFFHTLFSHMLKEQFSGLALARIDKSRKELRVRRWEGRAGVKRRGENDLREGVKEGECNWSGGLRARGFVLRWGGRWGGWGRELPNCSGGGVKFLFCEVGTGIVGMCGVTVDTFVSDWGRNGAGKLRETVGPGLMVFSDLFNFQGSCQCQHSQLSSLAERRWLYFMRAIRNKRRRKKLKEELKEKWGMETLTHQEECKQYFNHANRRLLGNLHFGVLTGGHCCLGSNLEAKLVCLELQTDFQEDAAIFFGFWRMW